MSARALLAAIAVAAVPVALHAAQPQREQRANPQAKRTCSVRPEIGSRINTIRACRNAAEREAARQEQRQVIDRIQSNKVSFGQ